MNTTLCISIRFIQPYPLFHGSRDAGQPEWPPSPMRLFQSLLNASCLRVRGRPLAPEVRKAFKVLEVLRPHVVAPAATVSDIGYCAYVPHNQHDLVATALHRGMEQSSEAFRKLNGSVRVDKDHRPMRITTVGNDLPTVHYLYSLDNTTADPKALLEAIRPSVRAIHCLGWGIDQVIADATLIDASAELPGERWSPSTRGGTPLRAPRNGSLDALHARHDRFLSRLTGSDWTPVPPLTAVDKVGYRRSTDPLPRPHAVFRLLDAYGDPARYPHAKLVHIAGMVRHLAIESLKGRAPRAVVDPGEWLSRFVRGKGDNTEASHEKISFVPLPSIGQSGQARAHADAMIRNIMLVAPVGCEDQLDFVARHIDGRQLTPETKPDADDDTCATDSVPVGLPDSIERFTPPRGKFIDTCYLGSSRVWESVTPVILDGHNDKKDAKTIKLIQAALQRAGIETPCEFTWQSLPYIRHGLSADKYRLDASAPDGKRATGYHFPKHLKDRTVLHVRLTFAHEVPGPITLGAGRHCGFGLMAAVEC